jgi:hypothetical protein
MKIIGVILSILLVTVMACEDKAVITQEENGITKIIIQIHPSFHKKSMFLWDVEHGEVIFNHIGHKKGVKFSLDPNVSGEVLAPKSICFKLDAVSANFLRDSIKLESKDLIDDEENGEFDGASISMLFVFKNRTIKDVDFCLRRDKKSKIIKFLIDAAIPHQQDSASRAYLKAIRKYFPMEKFDFNN